MDTAAYVTLSRQSGLMQEMQTIANNIANASTTGFRREGVVFAEYIARLGRGEESLSMAAPLARRIDPTQGALTPSGSPFDLAIRGDGFFAVQTPQGPRLTRAGAFATDANGTLVTSDGNPVLDSGGAPIFIPPDAPPAIGRDGTISSGGRPVGQVGLVLPSDPNGLERAGDGLFKAAAGTVPVESPDILQGFTEASNVDPMAEIARMIEVQHAYEQGQKFLDQEDQRVRSVISTLGR